MIFAELNFDRDDALGALAVAALILAIMTPLFGAMTDKLGEALVLLDLFMLGGSAILFMVVLCG